MMPNISSWIGTPLLFEIWEHWVQCSSVPASEKQGTCIFLLQREFGYIGLKSIDYVVLNVSQTDTEHISQSRERSYWTLRNCLFKMERFCCNTGAWSSGRWAEGDKNSRGLEIHPLTWGSWLPWRSQLIGLHCSLSVSFSKWICLSLCEVRKSAEKITNNGKRRAL